ncbi:sensor histidine kinase [Sphingomonas mollis]|uniref:histidine kinase n=1 Tax=Sphingomonas mollis TaxID=2795726 RepID=A0ABS0XM52_9SPHN|nr:HAMP domain-containing sensor histidine kinase [Sphingomonas sp. BT553]MBJ6121111.1 HAMP domain-containing histidine kinase [Sphingomonas sp. BT553]
MRFDDSLTTVLSADQGPGLGAQSAWRQLVDLMGRGRIEATDENMARLASLREVVPLPVRVASARALAFARPPAVLVGFFAADELAIAAPVLRMVALPVDDWLGLISGLSPAGRSILRQRRDLHDEVKRGLESLGSVDFVLSDETVEAIEMAEPIDEDINGDIDRDIEPIDTGVVEEAAVIPIVDEPDDLADILDLAEPTSEAAPVSAVDLTPSPTMPWSATPFTALGDITRGLPLVADALRRFDVPPIAPPPRFEIADLVARIEAFNRGRDERPASMAPEPIEDGFRFETDATGVIRWVEGVARGALVGVSLAMPGGSALIPGAQAPLQGLARLDAGAAAAFRQRARFVDLRLEVGGLSDAAGSWRIAGTPRFEAASGRFTGYYGTGRRPLRHESAAPATAAQVTMSDGLRQLVHELRTPANAVAGFAELIETELLGPVPASYRLRAGAIRHQAVDLLAAIDDLDTAARIEGGALDLRPAEVMLGELVARTMQDMEPLARQRGATLMLSGEDTVAATDDRAAERLFARLLAALVSAAQPGERIGVAVHPVGDQAVVTVDRPRALADLPGDALFSLDGGIGSGGDGAPLLGAGFTLRLVRNLATELGGVLAIDADRLTLRLPAAFVPAAEHAAGI